MIILSLILHCILFTFLFKVLAEANIVNPLKILTSLVPKEKNANLLYHQLMKLNSNTLRKSKTYDLAQYKFFTEIIELLIKNTVCYGTSLNSQLPEIKKGLLKDIRLDKKLFGIYLGGVYQIVLTFILGIVFYIVFLLQLGLQLSWEHLSLFIFLQILGGLSFTSLYIFLRKFYFSQLFLYLARFYQLRSLAEANMPLKYIAKKLEISELSQKGELAIFKERVLLLLDQVRKQGAISLEDVDLYINELWQFFDYQFEKFDKKLTIGKLGCLVIFSLSGYLFLFLQIFSMLAI